MSDVKSGNSINEFEKDYDNAIENRNLKEFCKLYYYPFEKESSFDKKFYKLKSI